MTKCYKYSETDVIFVYANNLIFFLLKHVYAFMYAHTHTENELEKFSSFLVFLCLTENKIKSQNVQKRKQLQQADNGFKQQKMHESNI